MVCASLYLRTVHPSSSVWKVSRPREGPRSSPQDSFLAMSYHLPPPVMLHRYFWVRGGGERGGRGDGGGGEIIFFLPMCTFIQLSLLTQSLSLSLSSPPPPNFNLAFLPLPPFSPPPPFSTVVHVSLLLLPPLFGYEERGLHCLDYPSWENSSLLIFFPPFPPLLPRGKLRFPKKKKRKKIRAEGGKQKRRGKWD